nr:synapse differentiation-inducing gene protein 1 isoform X1 [Chelonoidis abingdonii]XP_032626423.1 synapse differentiation-inducing gene protein 1 isoform X1 [Chelonoidis abingdonii]XP_032626424.1 synapse differentiation-inducing gene protein 1 isoform X1 [Chelonoidis abingdonii]XP_032626425.1 synapse differentiation-inducing gene protein 1 isoform X1 [Chelonoidis abingdonii]XP_032626426.1 synapse differentiation-inducing gene protein 1 isoform X1 [Chelonoidis abingdonii]XP_032626427.1 synap
MDGLLEQTSVLMHSKIAEAGKRNGLINTRNLMAENRDGLVSVYPAPQYQSHIVGNLAAQSRNDPVQQLLDPNTLQQTVESHYRPNIILYSENVLRSWGESVSAECCETTFIEDHSPTKDSLEYPDSKFIDLSGDDIKIHTLSYDVEEDEDFQELERQVWEFSIQKLALMFEMHVCKVPAPMCSRALRFLALVWKQLTISSLHILCQPWSDYSSDTESEDNFLMMPPRDHLGLSVFSMLCCFWPLGIAAFYLSHESIIPPRGMLFSQLKHRTCDKMQLMHVAQCSGEIGKRNLFGSEIQKLFVARARCCYVRPAALTRTGQRHFNGTIFS